MDDFKIDWYDSRTQDEKMGSSNSDQIGGLGSDSYLRNIAPARTFVDSQAIKKLRDMGLIKVREFHHYHSW